jgi:hypothetical protein
MSSEVSTLSKLLWGGEFNAYTPLHLVGVGAAGYFLMPPLVNWVSEKFGNESTKTKKKRERKVRQLGYSPVAASPAANQNMEVAYRD